MVNTIYTLSVAELMNTIRTRVAWHTCGVRLHLQCYSWVIHISVIIV